ncbi:ABC transporter ATP-binding protein [Spirochaeta cellobiosiphila]|uniref:ABC transporter ATP-binding protein n=1 Tax=Spirochaeta cellobiosiphila TaxID=504483 RepID=UPI000427EEC8|nr:ABC transporter ATP-binding protein [Spirochaeta cellobiosiphila]
MNLDINDLSTGYGQKQIIKELNQRISSGEITCLIGPNGSGKSTLLRAIAKLLPMKQGYIYLNGKDISQYKPSEYARKLGFLPQISSQQIQTTVKELVKRGRYPYMGIFQNLQDSDEVAINKALSIAGLMELADKPIDELSGGQRQRAWIAMALAQDTEILLLDEPTTYLDINHRHEILQLIDDLCHIENKTVIVVLHDLNEASLLAHNVIAMANGDVMAFGKGNDIFNSSLMSRLYSTACEEYKTNAPNNLPIILPINNQTIQKSTDDSFPSSLTFNNVKLGYGDQTIINELNLEIKQGTITVILGPNGCGKSTLLKGLIADLHPQSGEILLNNIDTRTLNAHKRAAKIAMLYQQEDLPEYCSVIEYVQLGRYRHNHWYDQWNRTDRALIDEALSTVNMLEYKKTDIHSLSGGQQQRVRFARLLVQQSDMIVLDEPTSFLDLKSQVDVLECVKKLNKTFGTTVIMVLHDPWQACRYADEVILMNNGSVTNYGKVKSVLSPKALTDLYNVPWIDLGKEAPLLMPYHTA